MTNTTQPTPKTVALVLTYNSGAAAIKCLESLFASTCAGLEIRVVDNASTDDTVACIEAQFRGLSVLQAASNAGFGAGCNLGIERAIQDGCDYVVLVNPDATVAPDALERLVQLAEQTPSAGAIGAKTLSMDPMPDGRPRLLYAGSFATRFPLRQSVPGIERADPGSPTTPIEVDYIWGHGVLLRLSAIREVGAFDEAFFMYYEDLDLCLRLQRAGYTTWCDRGALMWHDSPDGARAINSELWRWRYKAVSMGVFHAKHFGGLRGRCLSLVTFLAESAQLLRQGHGRAWWHQLTATVSNVFRRF